MRQREREREEKEIKWGEIIHGLHSSDVVPAGSHHELESTTEEQCCDSPCAERGDVIGRCRECQRPNTNAVKTRVENHAAPNTHPGGVQGALLRLMYHSPVVSPFIKYAPNPSAPKFSMVKIINLTVFISFITNEVMILFNFKKRFNLIELSKSF